MRKVNILLTGTLPVADRNAGQDRLFDFQTIGPEGPERLADGPTWIFVDWIMPQMSGLQMVRRLRTDDRLRDAHITVVLDRDDDDDRRRTIEAGADDYVLGPLDSNGLLDRILTLQSQQGVRRAPARERVGRLEIVPAAELARWDGQALRLSPNEFRLLRYLLARRGRVTTRKDIIAGLGKLDPPIDERTVDVWIGRLRKALRRSGAQDPIRTVRNRGYVLDIED